MNDRRVLVYEDDSATLDQIQSVLSSLGVEAIIGNDPDDVLDASSRLKPDLIILSADIKHGFSACLKLKKDKTLRRVPLFMISGKTPADVINKHQRLPTRADVYLSTPLSAVMLTEILREQLPALPTQPVGVPAPQASQTSQMSPIPGQTDVPPQHVPEIDVNDIPDRTMVSNRSFEAAVVNFVEDEVRDLKSTVVRLESEKHDLNGKLGDLESMLRNQSDALNESLQAMREHQEVILRTSQQTDPSALQDLNRLIDDAVREAVARANQQAEAVAEKAREKLEKELEDALSRVDALKDAADETARQRKQIGKLEKQVEDAKRREAEARAAADAIESDLRKEMDGTMEMFGRLESGYKESIAALEEERDMLQDRILDAENEIEDLKSKLAKMQAMADQFPALQEAAARTEVLSSENRKLQRAADRLQDRVDELEACEKEARELRADLEKAEKSEKATRDELVDLRKKFNQVKSLLGLNQLGGNNGDEDGAGGPAPKEGRSE